MSAKSTCPMNSRGVPSLQGQSNLDPRFGIPPVKVFVSSSHSLKMIALRVAALTLAMASGSGGAAGARDSAPPFFRLRAFLIQLNMPLIIGEAYQKIYYLRTIMRLEIPSGSRAERLASAAEAEVCIEWDDLEADKEADFASATKSGAEIRDRENGLSIVEVVDEVVLL